MDWLYSNTTSVQGIVNAGGKAVQHWGYNATKSSAAIDAGLVYYPTQWDCAQGEASVDEAAIRSFINSNPSKLKGLTWLAFNEPDLESQADCTPSQAARAFHRLDEVLRSGNNPADPTAKLYCCGLVDSAKWFGFLQGFKDVYGNEYGGSPPVDGVHLHLYNAQGARLNWCRLVNRLDSFRNWQSSQSWLAGKPIVVSEWGVLSSTSEYPNDPQYMVGNCTPGCECDTMAQMWNAFEQRSYVLHHLWWGTYIDAGSGDPNQAGDVGSIFTNSLGTQLTNPVGLKYQELSTHR